MALMQALSLASRCALVAPASTRWASGHRHRRRVRAALPGAAGMSGSGSAIRDQLDREVLFVPGLARSHCDCGYCLTLGGEYAYRMGDLAYCSLECAQQRSLAGRALLYLLRVVV